MVVLKADPWITKIGEDTYCFENGIGEMYNCFHLSKCRLSQIYIQFNLEVHKLRRILCSFLFFLSVYFKSFV